MTNKPLTAEAASAAEEREQQEPARCVIDVEELTKAILHGLEAAMGSFKTDRASTDDNTQA